VTPALINTVSIPKMIELSGHERVSVLKIDIEGAERELFSVGVNESMNGLTASITLQSSSTAKIVQNCFLMQ
jgi:hypothetical protein